ncbi:MAG: lantibiotic immunity ABC transporter MutE/EpiE family permease subunit [Clostridiales bacterium]|nr:lantibiotic immunity ABC transporter MutE/EpiE family permease subunit [Clostridiales bacterium]
MFDIIKSEFQKSKRTSTNKLILITPLFSIILSALFGGGQNGAYNWWYAMFLPALLALIAAQTIAREKNLSYKGVLLYPQSKGEIWMGKILYISVLLVFTNLIFMVGVEVFALIYGSTVPLRANILGTIVLIFTFLFNIPIIMFLTAKFNIFLAVLFNLGMTILGVVSYGSGVNLILKILPYGTSSTLMVPILGILPNGLPAPEGKPMPNGTEVLSSTLISIIIFLILTILTTMWFGKKEVN